MKKYCLLAFAFICLFTHSFAGIIVLEGKYQNKNIYIQNSTSSSGVGFCAYEVKVNGNVTTDEINSSAFEIDLSIQQLKFGDNVLIEIKYKDGCTPKVLNPEVLKPRPTFETKSFTVDKDGVLKWSTTNEEGPLPFTIEQFRWNKWVVVGEVMGKGFPNDNNYLFKITLHSGENKFRIKQVGVTNMPRYSPIASIKTNTPKPDYKMANKNTILLDKESLFEVYDVYGVIIKKGFAKEIDITSLKKGSYYFCYDNIVTELVKK